MSLPTRPVQFLPIPCASCGKEDAVPMITLPVWHKGSCHGLPITIVVCRECGLVYMNPQMSEADYTHFYTEEYWQLNAVSLEHVSEEHEKFAAQLYEFLATKTPGGLGTGKKILDIGCGTGEALNYVKTRTQSIGYGIEPSENASQWAREKYGHTIVQRDFFDNQLPDGEFDLIIASAVLEHFTDPVRALQEMKRLLRPNGYLYIRVPNLANCNLKRHAVRKVFKIPHTYYFTPTTLGTILHKIGLAPVVMDAVPYTPQQCQGDIWTLCRIGVSTEVAAKEDYRKILASIRSAQRSSAIPRLMVQTRRTAGRIVRSLSGKK